MSRDFQSALNDVVSAFAEGISDECKDKPGVDKAEVDCGVAAALINAAALITVRRGGSVQDVLDMVRDHAEALRSEIQRPEVH